MQSLKNMAQIMNLNSSMRSRYEEWMALSDEEKARHREKINAKYRPPTITAERLRLSGIPKKYQNAKIVSESCSNAFQQLERKKISGVVLQGEAGRGKTYTACAMLLSHMKHSSGTFATMNDILARVRAAYSSGENPDEIFGRFRGTPLLVIDDLGKENVSADSITKLFELLDARIANERPTIVTTQFTNNELLKRYASRVNEPEIISAILSRLSQFTPIVFRGKDRRK